MRNRILIVAVLVILALTAVALQMRSSERIDELASRELLSPEQQQQLAGLERITLSKGESSVELALLDGNWGVLSHAGFPVQKERLAALLHALRGARVIEEKTSNPDHHARLGLATDDASHPPLQVQLHAAGEDFGVIYGNRVGNGQLVRIVGSDQVLLINRPFGMSVNPQDWLSLQVVDMPLTLVSRARWQHADGETLELSKAAEGEYNLQLEGADAEQGGNERQINSMVLALVNLRAQNVALREELALPEPMLQMQVDTWAGSELQASLYDLEGRYWLLIDSYTAAEPGTELQVNADPRCAYQVGVADMETLTRRRQDLLRSGVSDCHLPPPLAGRSWSGHRVSDGKCTSPPLAAARTLARIEARPLYTLFQVGRMTGLPAALPMPGAMPHQVSHQVSNGRCTECRYRRSGFPGGVESFVMWRRW